MKAKRHKPLAVIGRDPRAEIHLAKFHPFESTKYLNAAALKKANKALIEIGTIEGGGVKVAVAAEVTKGIITKVKPVDCIDCAQVSTKSRSRKLASRGAHRKLMRQVLGKVRSAGYSTIKLPPPIVSGRVVHIPPFGPIVIVIVFDGDFDICLLVCSDEECCSYCLFFPPFCDPR